MQKQHAGHLNLRQEVSDSIEVKYKAPLFSIARAVYSWDRACFDLLQLPETCIHYGNTALKPCRP